MQYNLLRNVHVALFAHGLNLGMSTLKLSAASCGSQVCAQEFFPVQYIPFRLKELDIGRGSPGKTTKPDAMM